MPKRPPSEMNEYELLDEMERVLSGSRLDEFVYFIRHVRDLKKENDSLRAKIARLEGAPKKRKRKANRTARAEA